MRAKKVVKSGDPRIPRKAKKPYASPKLTVHGNVEKITQLLSGGGSDLIAGSQPGG